MQHIRLRQLQLLRCIVQSHVRTAAPISSEHIVRFHPLSCSTATIRNDMANLESEGFLQQPHTSAGRIPTDKAYRFYVDSLMRRERLSCDEQRQIRNLMDCPGDIDDILQHASKLLSQISNELAVVLKPFVSHAVFDHMELIGLADRKVLVVIKVRTRSVRTIILQMDREVKPAVLSKTANLSNERLSGLTLGEIKNSIRNRCQDLVFNDFELLRLLIASSEGIFGFAESTDMRTSGTNNIISQPEFSDKAVLETLFELLEERHGLSLVLKQDRPFQVVIGQEHQDARFKHFSVISAQYCIGEDTGSIGVIGPIRMRYSKILPLVERMAGMISTHLG
jgi:heat-inducible transcriptional repressor